MYFLQERKTSSDAKIDNARLTSKMTISHVSISLFGVVPKLKRSNRTNPIAVPNQNRLNREMKKHIAPAPKARNIAPRRARVR
jgi:hypothetical protein